MASQRQLPPRQGSFVDRMRDSLTRLPSFNTKRTKPASNHQDDEMNVFASDIVSHEYLLGELKEVRHNLAIVKLEIEDLLVSNTHNSFLPVIKAILVTDERKWKYLRFLDTISSNDILWWQGMKHLLMREYETTIDEESKYADLVTFQANVNVTEGATKKSIRSLLKSIENDEDVQSVAFAGALFGYGNDSVPGALSELFDSNGCLTDSFVINVKCGWQSHGDHETCCCKVLKACQRVLRGDDLLPSKLEATLERGRRLPRRSKSGDVASLASTNSNRSAASASAHSTRSDGKPRRVGRLSGTSDCPIIVQGDVKRSITMPAPAGHSAHTPKLKRNLPSKSSSFTIKRPTSLLDNTVGAKPSSLGRAAPENRSMARRTKSFQHQRPATEIPDDNRNYRWGNQASGNKDSGGVAKAATPPRKPVRGGDAPTNSASVSPKPKHRRIKSLDKMALELTENGKKDAKPDAKPDYDWSNGNYVVSSAA